MASGNPTLPTLDNAGASVLQNTTPSLVGAKHIQHGHPTSGDPNVATAFTTREDQVHKLLEGIIRGATVRVATLAVGIFSCNYRVAGADKSYAGDTSIALSANNTHYLWLDATATIQTNTTGFPVDIFRLAVVTTGSTDITSISDRRFENAEVGGALVAGVQSEWLYRAPYAMVIREFTANVGTAPTGGSAIFDLQVDSGGGFASIFASEPEMTNISDGTQTGISATKNHSISAGDKLRIEIKSTGSSPNGAADLSFSINAAIAPQKAP